MKLTTIRIVSVDGVMQGLGAPDEDRSGGFERGGWATPLFDQHSDRLLLVRAACVAEGKPGTRIDESRHRESSQLTGSPGSPRAHETRQRRTP
jgi:hypothetical protein